MAARRTVTPSTTIHHLDEPLPDAAAMARFLRTNLRVGDAVLTGCAEPLSWIIRTGSRADYSHMAIVTGPDRLTEAYDYAMTPNEVDEGIYAISLDDFLARPTRPHLLEIRRPHHLDPDRLVQGARWLEQHSPSFPTVGMACLALCGLTDPLLNLLPGAVRRGLLFRQAALASDGTARMHCAETATRLYHHAGVPLRFPQPRLWRHIELVGRPEPPWNLAELPTVDRAATPGRWPAGRMRSAAAAARGLPRVWRDRCRTGAVADVADFILPGDYARAQPFTTVARFRLGPDGWSLAIRETPAVVALRATRSIQTARGRVSRGRVEVGGGAPGAAPPASAGSPGPRSTEGGHRSRRTRWRSPRHGGW